MTLVRILVTWRRVVMGRQCTRSPLGAGKRPAPHLGDSFLGEHLNGCLGMARGTLWSCGCAVTTKLLCYN